MMRLLCFIFLVFSFFLHAEEELKQVSVLPSGSVYQGDYFSCGQNIEISGKIVGDTYVLGGQITVDGVIDGDLLVCGGSVDLAGKVQGNVRMLGGQLLISGSVEKNVSAVAGNILVLPCAYIGEGFVAAAGNIDVGAQIGGGNDARCFLCACCFFYPQQSDSIYRATQTHLEKPYWRRSFLSQ